MIRSMSYLGTRQKNAPNSFALGLLICGHAFSVPLDWRVSLLPGVYGGYRVDIKLII
jgi:hypothetical protein